MTSNESHGLSIMVVDGVLSVDVSATAIQGVTEILINPEYSTDWVIDEILRGVSDEEATEKRKGLEYLSE